MGLFSREKTTYVSSVAYNLAGDEDQRFQFLKTNVIGAAIGNKPVSETLIKSYLAGPGSKLRGFPNWAENGDYLDHVGTVSGSISSAPDIDIDVLKTQIPHAVDEEVTITESTIDIADYSYWAEQYILDNYPERINTPYTLDIVPIGLIGFTHSIHISFTSDSFTDNFYPYDFNINSKYLYAIYNLSKAGDPGSLVTGSEIEILLSDPYPDTTGWTLASSVSNTVPVTLNEVTVIDVTYSDATPPEHSSSSTSTSDSYTDFLEQWTQTNPAPVVAGVDEIATITSYLNLIETSSIEPEVVVTTVDEDIGGGVIKTTVTTVTTDTLVPKKAYRTDTRKDVVKSYSKPKVFIYKYQNGNALLDAMFSVEYANGIFFPPIPFRINNADVKDSYSDLYEASKKAFKRAVGGKYDEVRETINSNSSIGDIDYAYVMFGVSLNVKENACKKYIYKFFDHMRLNLPNGYSNYLDFKIAWQAARDSWAAWGQWRSDFIADLAAAEDEPIRLPYPQLKASQGIDVNSDRSTLLTYKISMWWNYVIENTGSGMYDSEIKVGELKFIVGDSDEFSELYWGEDADGVMELKTAESEYSDIIVLIWQKTETEWTSLIINGLTHSNYVYDGKWVDTKGVTALTDPEESGLIIPLHQDIFREMGIVDYTQMSTACCFVVFNCYQEVEEKWYQTTGFTVILLIIAVVVTILNPPAGAAVFSTAMSINTIVTIIVQAIVQAIVNAMIAMIISQLLTIAATALFGDKVGRIVGAIATVVVMAYAGSATGTGNFNFDINTLTTAPNLLMLTQVTLDAYSQYVVSQANKTMVEMNEYAKEASATLKTIQDKYAEDFGSNGFILDALALVDSAKVFYETSETFLQRTTMTGVDIVEMSLDVVHNFVEITMSNRLPLEI